MDGLVGRHRLSAGACCTIFQVSPAPFLVPTTLSGLSNPLPGKSVRVQTYQTGSLSFPLLSPPTVAPSYANLTLLNLPLPSSSSPKYPFLLLLPRLFSCNAKKIPSPHGFPSLPLSIYPNFPSQTKHEFPSGKRTKSRSVKAGKREGAKVEVAQVQFLRETQVHRRLLFGPPIFSLLGVPKRALEKRIDDREFSSSPKVFPRIIQLRKK